MTTSDTGLLPPAASGHGGRRSGAGAPKSNTNALRTGLYSKRLHAMLRALRRDPLFVTTYRLLIQTAVKQKPSTRLAAAALLSTLDSLAVSHPASSLSNITSATASESEQLPPGATGINQDNAQTHARKYR